MQQGHALRQSLSLGLATLMAATFLYLAFMPAPSLFAG